MGQNAAGGQVPGAFQLGGYGSGAQNPWMQQMAMAQAQGQPQFSQGSAQGGGYQTPFQMGAAQSGWQAPQFTMPAVQGLQGGQGQPPVMNIPAFQLPAQMQMQSSGNAMLGQGLPAGAALTPTVAQQTAAAAAATAQQNANAPPSVHLGGPDDPNQNAGGE